jgi:tRNA-2-methylthio-N6-dimethylallyladenosine synthase
MGLKEKDKDGCPRSPTVFLQKQKTGLAAGTPVARFSGRTKVFLKTYGCQMNEHDSGRVKGLLLSEGFRFSDKPEKADVLLFNTCSVRGHAEDRVFGLVSSLKRLKARRPDVIFGLMGCMAEAQRENIFVRLPHVDFLCGPADIDKIPEIIERVRNNARRLVYLGGHKSGRIPEFPGDRNADKNAYVKITEGCDNFCSYCIVPYVRGRERSRPADEILREIKGLVEKGVTRITLLGQNVNSYGRGLKEGLTFPELLGKIDKLTQGRSEINFFTSHPKDANIELFRIMAAGRSLSKILHLPLQSGSDRILKRMNRGYTAARYKRLVRDFRKTVKGSSLSTDLIVGFPGETKKDFNDTMKAVKEIKFDSAYIFKYSPRPFTKAAKFKDSVSEREKEVRHALLLSTQREICSAKKHCREAA